MFGQYYACRWISMQKKKKLYDLFTFMSIMCVHMHLINKNTNISSSVMII